MDLTIRLTRRLAWPIVDHGVDFDSFADSVSLAILEWMRVAAYWDGSALTLSGRRAGECCRLLGKHYVMFAKQITTNKTCRECKEMSRRGAASLARPSAATK
jgi:hypothetical protein